MLDLERIEDLLKPIGEVLTIAEFAEIERVPISQSRPTLFVMDLGYTNPDNPKGTGFAMAFEEEVFGVMTAMRFVKQKNGNKALLEIRMSIRKKLFAKVPDAEYAAIGLAGGKPFRIKDKKLYYMDMFKTSHIEMEEV